MSTILGRGMTTSIIKVWTGIPGDHVQFQPQGRKSGPCVVVHDV